MQITEQRLKEILSRAGKLRIAVLGDLMVDVYLIGSASRMSQEAPVPVLRVRKTERRPGGAANVMRNITSFGAKAIAFGVIGEDAAGEELRRLLAESGIDATRLAVDRKRKTTEKMRVMTANQQIVRVDFEDVFPVSRAVAAKMEKQLAALIRELKIDAVIFEDYNKGLMDRETIQHLADLAREYGIITALDPHPGHPMEIQNLSVMTPNRSEAFGLAGLYCYDAVSPVEQDENLKHVASRILKTWNVESLLITLGPQGMALFRKRKALHAIPTKAKEVFDVSGAGDTVIALYTLCRAAGADDQEAAEIANRAAGIVVGKIGTAVTSPEELLAVFRQDGERK